MDNKKEKSDIPTFYNCHTHIFTIDHVPRYVGKKMIPVLFAYILNISVLNWLYTNLSLRKEGFLNKLKYERLPGLKRIWNKIIDFFRWTYLLYWIYLILTGIIGFIFKVVYRISKFLLSPFFGHRTKEGFKRYLGIARFATYIDQSKIFEVLRRSYPDNFSFVVLAMDMEYMDAGEPKISYLNQLEDLKILKKAYNHKLNVFIGVDPRRLQEDKSFIDYITNGIDDKYFAGIKLYPALGFYPFDKRFKTLYEYCLKYDVPIMTHCIEGTIYYRGSKSGNKGYQSSLNNKSEWSEHPILKVNGQKEKLSLPQKCNHDFTKNFTHPLNYKCLLDPVKATQYFGTKVDFSELKICLAHFGGSTEWDKYFEDIYETYNNNLFIDKNIGKATAFTNVQKIWHSASWLSIIYDLMAEYKNVYADMSFMLYNKSNFDLLKLLIDDPKVGHKILFGTDFYVVAQKGTEKRLYHTIRAELGEERFIKVASINAKKYLNNSVKK